MDYTQFERTAANIRTGIIKAVHNAGSGHPGGSLSAADLVTALYFKEMNIDPKKPEDGGKGQVYFIKGARGPGPVRGSCRTGIFPEGGHFTVEKTGKSVSGTSEYEKGSRH